MASLADLLNPSFFMFLGIMVLVIALLVVYFESKMRDQNHKISSMLSLVSTLAQDMNDMKMGLNHLTMTSIPMGGGKNSPFPTQNLGSMYHNEKTNELIEVSDEEDEEDEEDDLADINDIDDTDDDDTDDDDDDNDDDDNDDDDNDDDDDTSSRDDYIKVIKLNISQEESDTEEKADDLDELYGEFEVEDDIPEISQKYAEETLSLNYDEVKEDEIKENKALAEDHSSAEDHSLAEGHPWLEESIISETNLRDVVSELKTISINLGDEHHSEHTDFKKLQLPKLRSIVIEKGLTSISEAQKLKKPDILKLLGAE